MEGETPTANESNGTWHFLIALSALFSLFYGASFVVIGLSAKPGWYSSLVAQRLNYVEAYRQLLLESASFVLRLISVPNYVAGNFIKVEGGVRLHLNNSCLGFGVLSFLWAYCLSFPARWSLRIRQLVLGSIVFFLLNASRLVVLSVLYSYTAKFSLARVIDHHFIANVVLYIVLLAYLYASFRNVPVLQRS